MKMKTLYLLLAAMLCLLVTPVIAAEKAKAPASPAERSLRVCVAADAPAAVRRAAEAVLVAAKTHPLLQVLAGERAPEVLTDSTTLSAGPPEGRAFDHVVLVGLSTDPLVQAAWQREARFGKDGSIYIGGFGHLHGDIGYVESGRNPFLHSRFIARAPFETEIVTITGTNPAGVAIAAEAFLKRSLINGIVAGPGWTRPEPNLLQRDPLPAGFTFPDVLPTPADEWTRIGITQASEAEYRGVLADTGLKPREIWRAKYFRPGVWDGVGANAALANYSAGLHHRATGNAIWAARFASESEAQTAASKIADTAKLKHDVTGWKGEQPPHSWGKESPGPLTLWQRGEWVFMSTLPTAALPLTEPASRNP
jgi:hypothetical protein